MPIKVRIRISRTIAACIGGTGSNSGKY